jgi:hypothetical protein
MTTMKTTKYIFISLLVLLLTNCDLEKFPYDSLSKDDFGSLSGIKLLSTGIYSELSSGSDKLQISYNNYSSDDFVKLTRSANTEPGSFTTNLIDVAINGTTSWNLWKSCYKNIMTCNNVIAVNEIGTDVELNQAIAELYFLRAYNYYILSTLFTRPYTQMDISNLGLPLRLNPDDYSEASRSTLEELFQQMISDLEIASTHLSPVNDRTRASKEAAYALLARIYNSMLQPTNPDQAIATKAITAAESVLKSGKVVFETSATKFFGSSTVVLTKWPSGTKHYFSSASSSGETIWLLFRTSVTTLGNCIDAEYNQSKTGQYLPISKDYYNMLNKYPTDLRNNLIDKSYDSNGKIIYADAVYTAPSINCNKYSFQGGVINLGSMVVFRATEMYMILAEIYAKQGNVAKTLEYINYVRKRAGIEQFTEANWSSNAYGITNLVDLALNEKRLEMIGENQRKWDVYRNKKDMIRMYGFDSDNYLEAYQGGTIVRWNSKEIIVPIPYGQILQSPDMVQNPY